MGKKKKLLINIVIALHDTEFCWKVMSCAADFLLLNIVWYGYGIAFILNYKHGN